MILRELQLNRLFEWSEKWQMEFNIRNCSTLNLGKGNLFNNYTLNYTNLERSDYERDLRELLDYDLRPRAQCINARNRAFRILPFIAGNVSIRSKEVILRLHLLLIRPDLNYAVQS